MKDCTELDQSNFPSSGIRRSAGATSVVDVVLFTDQASIVELSAGPFPSVGFLTISTMARLMSFRMTKETRNPDQERKYSTSRAGILSGGGMEVVVVIFRFLSSYTTSVLPNNFFIFVGLWNSLSSIIQ